MYRREKSPSLGDTGENTMTVLHLKHALEVLPESAEVAIVYRAEGKPEVVVCAMGLYYYRADFVGIVGRVAEAHE